MFIDADIDPSQDVVKLLHRNKDIVTGAYPKVNHIAAVHGVALEQKPSILRTSKVPSIYVLNIKREHTDSRNNVSKD